MTAAATPSWTAEEQALVQASPHALALQLAIVASDLPGFDCADRAYLRRVGLALGPMQSDAAEALRLAREAVAARAGVGSMRSRPEAALLHCVLWLLGRAAASGPAI